MRRFSRRVWALVGVVALVTAAVLAYGIVEYRSSRAGDDGPRVAQTGLDAVAAVPHVVVRSTAPGDQYGLVALVPLDDPAGPRAFTDVTCDRVAAVPGSTSCLRTVRGIVTRYETTVLDDAWQVVATWPLPGVPNRTRLSASGNLVATTAFVTGHSYATVGFSTQTVIHDRDANVVLDLERFTLLVDDEAIAPVDRNMWGVTFADEDLFYATAQSRALGHTWLVRGSLADRTLTAVQDGGACPSLSPDGTRLAFKVETSSNPVHWSVGVLDLATGDEQLLAGEERSFDDQITWLDDDTLLYGLPREDEAGVTDVWSLDVDPESRPVLFIPQAWSPTVVRTP